MKALQDAFRNLAAPKTGVFAATVVSVDEAAGTCTITDGELEYTDVQLTATDGAVSRHVAVPKSGSFILAGPVQNDIHRLMVLMVSEVEKVVMRTEHAQMTMDDGGFLLKKENETLRQLMTDLLQEIQNMRFTTNAGPTIKLINKPALKAIENRFKSFLKEE